MKRLATDFLDKWRGGKDRRPLLIRGARQVGKTWLVREHGHTYPSFLEINLESEPEYLQLFRENFGKPQKLLPALSLLSGKKIRTGETLLFIDEIQESKEALLSLRYFKEELPDQHVIAAGSLLEFSFEELSFPVGRIEFFHLFPMNFEEFLLAERRDDLIGAILRTDEKNPLPDALHEKLLEEVTLYCLLGGLPEVLKTYVDSGDFQACQTVQQIHVATLREDFHKYASKANIEQLRLLFHGIPRLIGRKFKYSEIDPHIKSRELSSALGLLEKAGLIYKAPHSSARGLPLEAQINPKRFKVFFLDVGLSQRVLGTNLSQLFLEKKELLATRGALAEQFVAQELLSFTPQNQTPRLYYWHREAKSSEAEVDLLTEYDSHILPIEVKSGNKGALKSLHLFLNERGEEVPCGLKVSSANFSRHQKILSVPFYSLLKFGRGLPL